MSDGSGGQPGLRGQQAGPVAWLRGLWHSCQQYVATAHGAHDVRDYARAAVIMALTALGAAALIRWL